MSKEIKIKKIIKNIKNTGEVVTLHIDENDVYSECTITVKKTLGLHEAHNFVNSIAATCVGTEGNEYMPELFDFGMRMWTLLYYANVDMPKDAEEAYGVLYNTDLYDKVLSMIDQNQWDILIEAANDVVNQALAQNNAIATYHVAQMIQKMDAVMENGQQVLEQVNSDEFKSLLEKYSSLPGIETGADMLQAVMDDGK